MESPRFETSHKGLFRAVLGGPDGTVERVFRNLAAREREIVLSQPARKVTAARVPLAEEDGVGYWEFVNLYDRVLAVVTCCDYRETRYEHIPYEDFIEFHFTVNGPVRIDDLGLDITEMGDARMLLCARGPGMAYGVWCPPGPRRLLSLYVRPSFLLEELALSEAPSGSLAARLLRPAPDTIVSFQRPLQVAVAEAIRELMSAPYSGRRHLLFSEAKILGLLCLCAEEMEAEAGGAQSDIFTERDLRIFGRAREIISTSLDRPLTISSLAREVGTNTTKLKRGFKLVYGTTIFEFGQRYRMNHALQLLAGQKLPVRLVAEAVGYNQQASFASAFKRHFGFSPKEARKLAGAAPEDRRSA